MWTFFSQRNRQRDNSCPSGPVSGEKHRYFSHKPGPVSWGYHWCLVDCPWWWSTHASSVPAPPAQGNRMSEAENRSFLTVFLPSESAFLSLKSCRFGEGVRWGSSQWLRWMTTASRWRKTYRCSCTICVLMQRWKLWKWWDIILICVGLKSIIMF